VLNGENGVMNGYGAHKRNKENGKIKVPTRQTRVWGTQIRFRINRPGHPTRSDWGERGCGGVREVQKVTCRIEGQVEWNLRDRCM